MMMTYSSGTTTSSFGQSFTDGMEFKIEMSDLNENFVHLEEAKKNGDGPCHLKLDIWKWPKRKKLFINCNIFLSSFQILCKRYARDLVDEVLLPKENVATRWIKTIPIKEDTSHLFFSCDVALAISRLICQWWNVSWSPVDSYSGWLEWFNSIRLGSKLKGILEGVFYVSWWCLWNFRNQLLFASKKPRKETLFDDVVSRSFIWSNSRCNLKFTWDCWLQHPYLIAL
ncbi:hypothetical protein Tco_1335067 [Tanacetum coccineum]